MASFAFDAPLTLPCGLTLRNRVVRAAAFAGGSAREQAATLGEAARGGAAAVTVAYTAVSEDGRTFAAQLLLDPRRAPPDLAEIPRAAHAAGALALFQLTHAGGFADRALVPARAAPLAPSALFEPALLGFTRACAEADLARLEGDFAAAARLVCGEGVGADGVELHLGHGYLLSQWLSPVTNRRADEHGGSAANRLIFPMRVVRAVRAAIGPRKALVVKLNVDDGVAGGVSPADVAETVAALCAERGLVDALVPSAGFVSKNGFFMLRGRVPRAGMVRAISRASWTKGAALSLLGRWLVPELPFAEGFLGDGARGVLRAAAGVPVFAIGGFVSLGGVEAALAEGFAGVQMARALIREPDIVQRWRRFADAARAGAEPGAGDGDGAPSPCSHCNECVLGSLSPELPARCVERAPA
jgi:hypothetical protein